MEQLPKIVRQRLQATAKPGVHPDPDVLTAFAEKSLPRREHEDVLQHLGLCADCRHIVSLAMPVPEPAGAATHAKFFWLSWPVLRWSGVAACVVVVSTVMTMTFYHQARRSTQPNVAESIPVPPANSFPEKQIPSQPNDKLAEKTEPPSPSRSQRDFETMNKLTRPRESADTKSAAASAFNGITVKKVPAEKDQLTNLDAAKSADQSLQDARRMAAVAPPPAPAAKAMAGPQAAGRVDQPGYSANSSTGTVAAQNEAVSIRAGEQTAKTKSKSKDELAKNESAGQSEAVAAMSPGVQKPDQTFTGALAGTYDRPRATPEAQTKSTMRWTLSPEGALQQSFDSGKTWQTIPLASNVIWRALAANDSDIWVGGSGGTLYHSSDAGQHWMRINPLANGKPLTADIVRVEFKDPQHGLLITSSDQIWSTTDAGATWHIQ